MGHTAEQMRSAIDALAAIEPAFAATLARVGYPEPRVRDRGYGTLLRTIVGQQVSVKAAAAIWRKLEAGVGEIDSPDAMVEMADEDLRACGLSRQKIGYAKSLAGLVTTGELDLDTLPDDDEEAIAHLTKIKGIGRWSAEIYLLFAEGRLDIWPAGDLAVQVEVGRILGLPDRPSEKAIREIAERWRPHRGAAAVMSWHSYNTETI